MMHSSLHGMMLGKKYRQWQRSGQIASWVDGVSVLRWDPVHAQEAHAAAGGDIDTRPATWEVRHGARAWRGSKIERRKE
jgi:hypothetical protein